MKHNTSTSPAAASLPPQRLSADSSTSQACTPPEGIRASRARRAGHAVKLAVAGLGIVGLLALSACGSGASKNGAASASGDKDKISVVTTTNVYSSLASLVGGKYVDAKPLISSSSQDPHDFEPSAKDSLTVRKAGLVIENGGGYDDPVETLVKDANLPADAVINAVDISGLDVSGHDGKEGNEHVFYSLSTLEKVAERVHDRVEQLNPDSKVEVDKNLADVKGKLEDLQKRVGDMKGKAQGKSYFASEPIADYLFDDAGFKDATPQEFTSAIDEEHDASAATIKSMQDALAGKQVSFFSLNTQTETAQTKGLAEQAKKASIPVLDYTETITDGKDVLAWMQDNVQRLEGIL